MRSLFIQSRFRLFVLAVSLLFGMAGISCLVAAHTLTLWSKQIKLGYLDAVVKHSLEIQSISILLVTLFLIGVIVLSARYQALKGKLLFASGSTLIVLLGSYAALCLYIYWNQDEIINKNNIIFQSQKAESILSEAIQQSKLYGNSRIEEINLVAPDHTQLSGWLIKNEVQEKSPLIIYFGGAAEEVSDILLPATKLKGWSVAAINYRGFGLSEGTPTQENVFNDAALIYDYFIQRQDIDRERIVSMGYSLGTGAAVHLSNHRATEGTVLVAPFHNRTDKISHLFHLSYFPMSVIFKQPFNSISVAPKIRTPLLCLIGDEDKNTPNEISMRLVDKWGGKTYTKTIAGADHFLLFTRDEAWTEINAFLADL
ncbi:Alpha/beta hydrolase family protein [Paenibacillus konkukensis]|uniref:Alpha/beta hydrolase family protein n=1 Tax=Paenibacillus konkukensis TaxID=2020716 RepID=A0ABY4RH18_9BACL|nr:alpha/beta hydrolase [Paenibacillus konkukensis]UQZ81736.1 Alpha/beta hydrolase family protein [Paenibacillus konkukensis]